MSMTRRSLASVWLNLLLWTLLNGLAGSARAENRPGSGALAIDSQQAVTPAATTQPRSEQTAPGGCGGRGGGGLPPMNPIDENAPPPPLATPGKVPGEPPSDAVVLTSRGGPMTVMRFRNIWFRAIPQGK